MTLLILGLLIGGTIGILVAAILASTKTVSPAELAYEQRRHKEDVADLKRRSGLDVKFAAARGYRQGYRDGAEDVIERARGRAPEGVEPERVYRGNVPAPLGRWMDETLARLQEHL